MTADTMTRRLAVRAYERCGGAVPLGVAALVGVILAVTGFLWGATLLGDCGRAQLAAQLAGSAQRFDWLIQRCAVPTTPGPMLWADTLFIVGYWLACTAVLIAGWWRYEAPALRRASWVMFLPTAVAAADVIENLLLWRLLHADARADHGYRWLMADIGVLNAGDDPTGLLNCLLLTVSWAKWLCAFALVIAVVMAVAVWFSRRNDPFPPPPVPPRHHDQTHDLEVRDGGPNDPEMSSMVRVFQSARDEPFAPPGPRAGICLSGGGIRSTAFCLGVLSRLEGRYPRPATTARYLAAVSGGSWAATAWALQKAQTPGENAADRVINGLEKSAEPAGYQRQKYLLNARGGIVPALIWMLLSSLTNLLLVALLVYLIAWPLGWFMSHCVIDTGRLGVDVCGPAMLRRIGAPPDHLYIPGLVFAVLGALVLATCGFLNKREARIWPVGLVLVALGLFSAAYLDWLPDLFVLMRQNGSNIRSTFETAVGGSVAISFAAGVWKLVGGPLVKEVTGVLPRLLPRLLGFVLLAGVIAWALMVMYYVSQSRLPLVNHYVPWVSQWQAYAIPALVLLGMFAALGPNWPTLHNVFSARLQRSFDPVAHPLPPVDANTQTQAADQATWKWLRQRTVSDTEYGSTTNPDTVPELVLCCAQQRNGLAKGGLRAETFTVSPTYVRQGSYSVATDDYVTAAAHVKRFRGCSLEFGDLGRPSTWLATSGAAFSSAMGRMSLGSTNAFLAAVNADLGVWLPNVKVLRQQYLSTNTAALVLEAEILRLRNIKNSLAQAVAGADSSVTNEDPDLLALDRADFQLRVRELQGELAVQKAHVKKRAERVSTQASRTARLDAEALQQHIQDLEAAHNISNDSTTGPAPRRSSVSTDVVGQLPEDAARVDTLKELEAVDAEIEHTQGRLAKLVAAQDRHRLPRPRFAYILKEILGWYHSDDRYVFITDGGHWDNLGLIELLRRGCDEIYCVDASGDAPGTFATLRESLQLAALELDYNTEIIDLDEVLRPMTPQTSKALPAKVATTFSLTRNRRGPDAIRDVAPDLVTVHYTKLQPAQGMNDTLKRWAIADPKFPHYSTAQQFLRANQFSNLVELGRFAGEAVLASRQNRQTPLHQDGV